MSSEPNNKHDDEYQQWIDGLLGTAAAEAATPGGLSERIEARIRGYRRRSLVWKSTATVAAAASIVLLVIFQREPASLDVDRQVVSVPMSPDTHDGEDASEAPRPKATFVARSDLLAVPIESDDPQVTIIQIYPTTHTQRRRQREATLQAISDQLDSIKQFSSNGG